ncbi:MAG: S8 family serine peptidase [Meiothermus sp.]|nr:S8 family serine peptidase [Meiothermus sp.]
MRAFWVGLTLLALALTACSGPRGEVPVSTVKLEPSLKPAVSEIDGINGGPPRPVTTLSDQNGSQVDFVQNELIVITGDRPGLDALLARWNGQILDSIDLSALGVPEAKPVYLIRVNAANADTAKLAEDLKKIAPNVRSDLRLGSQEGLNLLAVQAREAAAGALLTPNWVWQPTGLEFGPVNESPNGDSDAGNGMNYAPDAYTWPYMREGGPQNIGVTRAWTALSLAGRLGNKVPIAILDGGFQTNADLPDTTNLGGWNLTNPSNCSGGSSCPWHGTGTALTAFGAADNGFGVAGVAGPVARRILVHGKFDAWSAMFQVAALSQLDATRPKVVNMSFAGNYPAVAAAAASVPMNIFTSAIRKAGILIVAAAGNDNLDLSEEDCFIVCWAKRSFYPCELNNVLCVGGIARNSRVRASFSNYRGKVDIYGPGTVWAPENNVTSGKMRLVNGTSVASPFVAGVAGLIWAANPGLGADDVERILLETAHTNNGDGVVGRVVNAAAAVGRALGSVPPTIRLGPNPGEAGLRLSKRLYSISPNPLANELFSVYHLEAERDINAVSVRVSSDRDGQLGNPFTFNTPGPRLLTITATTGGQTSQAFLNVNVVNAPPSITNLTAPETVGLLEGWAPITPVVATDPNEPGGVLPCNRVRWSVQGSDLLQNTTGCDNFVVFSEQGTRTVTVTATDPEGASTSRTLTVTVGPRPAQIRPSVSDFVVRDSTGAVLQDRASIGGFRTQCPLTATATIYNPDNAPLNLSWTLDNGTNLVSEALQYLNGGQQVRVACGSLEARRYFLQLFLPTTTPTPAKKRFTFDMEAIPPR